MTTIARFGALAGAALLTACGGGSSSPTTPRPPVLPTPTPVPAASFFDGATGAPVQPEVTPAAPVLSQPMSVKAPGYLIREQKFTGEPIYLWPADESYVSELVYDWAFTDGSYRMIRWASGFTVTLDGDLASNDIIVYKVQEVVTEIARVTGLPLVVGPGGDCVISLNSNLRPADGAVGRARLRFRGATIVGADVVFVERNEITGGVGSDYRNTLLHEMGHVLGLAHSIDPHDVMYPGGYLNPGARIGQFTEKESVSLRMMYRYRSAGNFPPDRDPGLGVRAASLAEPVRTVIED